MSIDFTIVYGFRFDQHCTIHVDTADITGHKQQLHRLVRSLVQNVCGTFIHPNQTYRGQSRRSLKTFLYDKDGDSAIDHSCRGWDMADVRRRLHGKTVYRTSALAFYWVQNHGWIHGLPVVLRNIIASYSDFASKLLLPRLVASLPTNPHDLFTTLYVSWLCPTWRNCTTLSIDYMDEVLRTFLKASNVRFDDFVLALYTRYQAITTAPPRIPYRCAYDAVLRRSHWRAHTSRHARWASGGYFLWSGGYFMYHLVYLACPQHHHHYSNRHQCVIHQRLRRNRRLNANYRTCSHG